MVMSRGCGDVWRNFVLPSLYLFTDNFLGEITVQVTEQKKLQHVVVNSEGKTWKMKAMVAWHWVKELQKRVIRVPVGIEPTISVTPVSCSNYWAARTPDELRSLNWLGSSHKLSWVHSVWCCSILYKLEKCYPYFFYIRHSSASFI